MRRTWHTRSRIVRFSLGSALLCAAMVFCASAFGWFDDAAASGRTLGDIHELRELVAREQQMLAEIVDRRTGGAIAYISGSSAQEVAARPHRIALAVTDKPATRARAYFAADLATGDVLIEKNARRQYPIASITKLMTAMVAEEELGNDAMISFEGERYRTADLYYPLMLRSNNHVADALAAAAATDRFVSAMNTKARALGMYHTRYADPSGLSAHNVSTAQDLFSLARYVYAKNDWLLSISRKPTYAILSESGAAWRMKNQNVFSEDDRFVGGKLGFTDEAMYTHLGIFTVPVDGELRTVAVIVLGSTDWKKDTREILTWVEAHGRVLPQSLLSTAG